MLHILHVIFTHHTFNNLRFRLNRAVHVCAQIEDCTTDKEAADASRRKRIQSGKPGKKYQRTRNT